MPYADPAKRREQRRVYDAAHRAEINARGVHAKRKYRHGMRAEDFARMVADQDGRCYLCGDELPDDPQKVHIDHDHTCCPDGKSCPACRRGLACRDCNHIIGLAHDDPDRLRRIADALRIARRAAAPRIAASVGQVIELW